MWKQKFMIKERKMKYSRLNEKVFWAPKGPKDSSQDMDLVHFNRTLFHWAALNLLEFVVFWKAIKMARFWAALKCRFYTVRIWTVLWCEGYSHQIPENFDYVIPQTLACVFKVILIPHGLLEKWKHSHVCKVEMFFLDWGIHFHVKNENYYFTVCCINN